MRAKNSPWTVEKFVHLKSAINPKPQYQRGDVWSRPKKQLLIDSILNHYDIPKIYLRSTRGAGLYDYEVADGQQRLRAIWSFVANEYPLARPSSANHTWSGKPFKELSVSDQSTILKFKLITAVIYDATNEEIRELFARLQKGERLTPPELRNSVPSVLGDIIRALAETHPFFTNSPFPSGRFRHDDLAAHAFAIELCGSEDLKAQNLAQMYETYSGGVDDAVKAKVNQVLGKLNGMQQSRPKCIRTKWGFVDLYCLISKNLAQLPSPAELATKYAAFEKRRLKYSPDPKQLLRQGSPKADQDLYSYIVAFKTAGGVADNVEARHEDRAQND